MGDAEMLQNTFRTGRLPLAKLGGDRWNDAGWTCTTVYRYLNQRKAETELYYSYQYGSFTQKSFTQIQFTQRQICTAETASSKSSTRSFASHLHDNVDVGETLVQDLRVSNSRHACQGAANDG